LLTSDAWYALNYGDYALYAAANHSLDLTIERLGKQRFEKALQMYRDAQKLVKKNAMQKPISLVLRMEKSNWSCQN
jgi:hypothetical protein